MATTEELHNSPYGTVVRLATEDDLSTLVELNAGLFREDAGQRDPFMNTTWVRREGHDYFATAVDDSDSVVLIADAHTDGVGYLVGRFSSASSMRTVSTAILESMFVRQDRRDRGVGTMLVHSFLDWARAREAGRVAVTAYAANEGAMRFYQRFGLRPRSVILDLPLSAASRR